MDNIQAGFDIDRDSRSAYFQSIAPYIYETVSAFSKLRDYVVSRIDAHVEDSEYIQFITPIINYIGERCQAFTMLMQYGYLWDAEILMRCIMEAATKVAFISYAPEAERKSRASEYWDDLSEINQLKRSDRAKVAVQIMGEENLKRSIKPLILSAKEEAELRAKWSSKKRKAIEQVVICKNHWLD